MFVTFIEKIFTETQNLNFSKIHMQHIFMTFDVKLKVRKIYIREYNVFRLETWSITDESDPDLVKFYYIMTKRKAIPCRHYQTAPKIDNGQIRGVVIDSYRWQSITLYPPLALLRKTWESSLIQPSRAKRGVTFRSWMHYRILLRLLKVMRGTILTVTFLRKLSACVTWNFFMTVILWGLKKESISFRSSLGEIHACETRLNSSDV